MWFAQISAKHFHTVSQCNVATTRIFWQSQNISFNSIAVVNNGVLHYAINNKYVAKKLGLINLLAANDNVYDTTGSSVPANGIPNDLNRQVCEAIVKGAIAYSDWGQR